MRIYLYSTERPAELTAPEHHTVCVDRRLLVAQRQGGGGDEAGNAPHHATGGGAVKERRLSPGQGDAAADQLRRQRRNSPVCQVTDPAEGRGVDRLPEVRR